MLGPPEVLVLAKQFCESLGTPTTKHRERARAPIQQHARVQKKIRDASTPVRSQQKQRQPGGRSIHKIKQNNPSVNNTKGELGRQNLYSICVDALDAEPMNSKFFFLLLF